MPNVQRLFCLLIIAAALIAVCPASGAAAEFPLKDGDIWVMAGDSITAQHLHSNYFEAFCFARYPRPKFAFRNSGVGGHTIPSTLARFDYDIAAWRPTVVSVELGMNDKGSTPTDKFIANMGTMVERIRAVKASPVILAASPVNDGSTKERLSGGNQRLHEYAVALKEFSAKEKVPYADQFHAVIDVWGKNKLREVLANTLPALRAAARDDKLAGAEHLRAFLDAQDKSPERLVSMMGDPVHPGPPGQLTMAAALLKELGANGFVSSATVDASGKVTEAKGCAVEGVKAEGGKLLFERLDECLPFPIPDDARAVLPLYPTILELSQYTLKVTGLPDDAFKDKEGRYTLQIDGVNVGTVTRRELDKGVNLTAFAQGPIAAQGKAVLAAVAAKEQLVGQWRALSRTASAADAPAAEKEKLAALTQQVEAADARIREAAKPKKLRFELTPAK